MYLNDAYFSLTGLTKAGYLKPSPIQLEAIPIGKCGIGPSNQNQAQTTVANLFYFEQIWLFSPNLERERHWSLVL